MFPLAHLISRIIFDNEALRIFTNDKQPFTNLMLFNIVSHSMYVFALYHRFCFAIVHFRSFMYLVQLSYISARTLYENLVVATCHD